MKDFQKLFDSGNWIIRTSDNGRSYQGFKWQPKNRWTTAPDWEASPKCGHGLHGQNAKWHGYFQISGERLELCETDTILVSIGGNKVKTPRAKIFAINEEIPIMFLDAIGLTFKDNIPLLRNLTSVGRNLFIYSNVELPALTSVGEDLSIYANVKAELPALTSVGGYLYLYPNVELPALTSVGGDLYLYSNAELPALTSVGGDKGKFIYNRFIREVNK